MTSGLLLIEPALNTHAQSPVSQKIHQPAFEVVEIEPSDPSAGAMGGKARILPGSKFEVSGVTIPQAIVFAYGVQENMITGGPDWSSKDRFDIVAKAAPDTTPATLRPMLQTLLVDRFKLQIHREGKPNACIRADARQARAQVTIQRRQDCNWATAKSGLRKRQCHNMTAAALASQLPG